MPEHHAVPTEDECYELIRRYSMRDNIVAHSVQVMKVSLALVENIRDPSTIHAGLVRAAALLHDIAKTCTIGSPELRHDLIGGEIMRGLGYDAIALIVESHVVFTNFLRDGPLEEREIVFYADKRVMHDRIVTIDERVRDLAERYGINDRVIALITENKKFILEVEDKIQRFLKKDVEEIVSEV